MKNSNLFENTFLRYFIMFITVIFAGPLLPGEIEKTEKIGEDIRPLYLVENEPIPNFINLEALYETKNQTSRYYAEALAIPLVLKKNLLFLAGGGYMSDQWNDSSRLHGGYLSLFLAGSFSDHIYFRTYQSAGIFGQWNDSNHLPWKYYQFTEAGYKFTPNFALDVGFLMITKFSENAFLPTLGVTYSLNQFIFDLVIPSYLSIRYIAAPEFHVVLKSEFVARDYRSELTTYNFQSLNTSLRLEVNIVSLIWLKAAFGYQITMNYKENGANNGYPDSLFIMIGLEGRTK